MNVEAGREHSDVGRRTQRGSIPTSEGCQDVYKYNKYIHCDTFTTVHLSPDTPLITAP